MSTTKTILKNPKIVSDGVTFEFFGDVELTVKQVVEEENPYLVRNSCGDIVFADWMQSKVVAVDVTLHAEGRSADGSLVVMKTEV